MNARWINAEITTCADRAVNRPRGQSPVWEGHILIVCDRFLILPRGRRNASRTQTLQLTRLGARRVALRRPAIAHVAISAFIHRAFISYPYVIL